MSIGHLAHVIFRRWIIFSGTMKEWAYVNKPQKTGARKDEIRRSIDEISEVLLQNVAQNFVKKTDVCRDARCGHLPEIIFHH